MGYNKLWALFFLIFFMLKGHAQDAETKDFQNQVLKALEENGLKGEVNAEGNVVIDRLSLEQNEIFLHGGKESEVAVMTSNMNRYTLYILATDAEIFSGDDKWIAYNVAGVCNNSAGIESKILINDYSTDISFEAPNVIPGKVRALDLEYALKDMSSMSKLFGELFLDNTRPNMSKPENQRTNYIIKDSNIINKPSAMVQVKHDSLMVYSGILEEKKKSLYVSVKKILDHLSLQYVIDEAGDIQFIYKNTAHYIHYIGNINFKMAAFNLLPDPQMKKKYPTLFTYVNESNKKYFGRVEFNRVYDIEISMQHALSDEVSVEEQGQVVLSWLNYFQEHIEYLETELRKL
jgi:hypothetical protein